MQKLFVMTIFCVCALHTFGQAKSGQVVKRSRNTVQSTTTTTTTPVPIVTTNSTTSGGVATTGSSGEMTKNETTEWSFDVQSFLDTAIRNKNTFRNKDEALVISVREKAGYKFFENKPKFVFLLTKPEEIRIKLKIQNYIMDIQQKGDTMKQGVKLDELGLPYDHYGILDLGSYGFVKQIYQDGETYGSEEVTNYLFYVSPMMGKTRLHVSFDFNIDNPHKVQVSLVDSVIDPKKKDVKKYSVDLSRSGHGSNTFIQAQLDFDDRRMNSRQKQLDDLFTKNEQRRLNLLAYQEALRKIRLFGRDVRKIVGPQKQLKFITATNIARQRESQIRS